MKLKPTVILATFVVTLGLLLGSGTAQAAPTVIVDENGNVTRIENLPVVDEATGDTIIYNVGFVNSVPADVYGDDFIFDFTYPEDNETILGALQAVTDALNAEVPIPPGASSEGAGQFFIGYVFFSGQFYAVGGERIQGAWDQCQTDCTDGVAEPGFGLNTYAKFREAPAPGVVQVFVTDETYPPDFGGLAGGDAICQQAAEAAGLGGSWTAWLSDDDQDAIDRIPDGEYQLLDGTVIAENKTDLTDGDLEAPINVNEFGYPDVPLSGAWTGTNPDGTGSFSNSNCENWTVAVPPPNRVAEWGATESTDTSWTRETNQTTCATTWHLYCFSGPAPANTVSIGGSVTGLEGSGLVLQNNGADDLEINTNGAFTFATPMTQGDSYNVTVAIEPSNPDQTCSVANGSGTVPAQAVTNVEVTCDPPEEPPEVNTAFLPAVYLLLLLGD